MAKITYIEHGGAAHVVDVAPGASVMEGAKENGIEGIEASCGGGCACATCHAYIDADQFARLPPPDDMEREMLEFAADPVAGRSRLTCQLKVTEAMDGLVVHIPSRQA